MFRTTITRLAGGVCCLALAVGGSLLASSPAHAATSSTAGISPATSTVGSQITSDEVLNRAADWYNRQIPYNTYGSAWDIGKTRLYRTDCSGFVDMALHLGGTEDNTAAFPTDYRFTHIIDINPDNHGRLVPGFIQRGDVLDDTSDGHAILFAWWAPDHVHFAYYSFGGGTSGTAPPELHHMASFSDGQLGFEPTNNYRVYRYNRIVQS